eukprot:16051784-Heterocapsa_arctica.AAC.1
MPDIDDEKESEKRLFDDQAAYELDGDISCGLVKMISDVGIGLLIPFDLLGAGLDIRGLIIVVICLIPKDGCGIGSSCCGICPMLNVTGVRYPAWQSLWDVPP